MPQPDPAKAPAASRFDKLFELSRQEARAAAPRQNQPGFVAERVVSPQFGRLFQADAIRSLGGVPASEQMDFLPNGQPRKPVATTNFSELSERDAGGLTLATLAKRCFKSF